MKLLSQTTVTSKFSFHVQVLISWLLNIADHVKLVEVHNSTDNGRKMCCVLLILNVLFKISDCYHSEDIKSSQISLLFSMLRLRPHLDQSQAMKFLDLDFLSSFIPDQHHIEVAKALVYFTKQVLPSGNTSPEWIFVLPLIHFFQKKIHIHPFDSPALTSEKINWTDESINFYLLSLSTKAKISK